MAGGAFLAADWGTTNLRVWRVGEDGQVQQGAEFPLGVSRLAPGEAAARFAAEVRPALAAEGLPALLCGMVGSTLGWTVAPYLDCPADLTTLADGLTRVAPGVRIVAGLRCAGLTGPDVMRGEETQVLGWLAGDAARARGRRLLCLPGTHAKWVLVEDGAVVRFATAMTGELYDLLGAHSVLRFAPPAGDDAAPFDLAAFDRGVAAAGDGGALAARLFGLRGLTLAGQLAVGSAGAWLSGLLIGAEIAAVAPLMGAGADSGLDIIGEAHLANLYRRVWEGGGRRCSVCPGGEAVLAGLTRLWRAAP